jgi:thiol:disulfide interchange protein DsbD
MRRAVWLGIWLLLALGLPAAAFAGDPLAALKGLTGGGAGEFLEPDQAFVTAVEAVDGQSLRARFEVADRYYLYRDKLTFKVEGGPALGEPRIPAGETKEDPYFGAVAIMHGAFEVLLPISRSGTGATDLTVTLGYQGCAEDGICYPPITRTFPVQLAPMPVAMAADAPSASETDQYADLLSGGLGFGVIAAFFGVGLLLSLTPCVFPMVPILSGIIVGHGHKATARHAFLLSLVYVLAMAATYAVAGVIAGRMGQNLQAWFQAPAVIVAFALVFAVLALSMFGFYELQIPASWQTRMAALGNRQRVGSLNGAAVMGVLSALIVGPCVAPPLAGALVYISRSGDSVLGGVALFAMALGMGVPLLAIGTSAGALLPRAGAWMVAVKKAFGVMMLAVAIGFLSRILPGPFTLSLWAVLLIITSVHLGALDRLGPEATGRQRLAQGLGLAMLVYGGTLVVGAAGGNDNVLRPLAGYNRAASSAEPAAPEFQPVRGPGGLKAAIREAAGRPVVLDFYADWCVECKKLERETFTDAAVQSSLTQAVLLRADVTANDAEDRALLKELGILGPPAILFFDARGEERRTLRLQGFVEPAPFVRHIRTAFTPCQESDQLLC